MKKLNGARALVLVAAVVAMFATSVSQAEAGRWCRRGRCCTTRCTQGYNYASCLATGEMKVVADEFVLWGTNGPELNTNAKISVQLLGDDALIRSLEGEEAIVVFKCEINEEHVVLVRMPTKKIGKDGLVEFDVYKGGFGTALSAAVKAAHPKCEIKSVKVNALLRTVNTLVYGTLEEVQVFSTK